MQLDKKIIVMTRKGNKKNSDRQLSLSFFVVNDQKNIYIDTKMQRGIIIK